MQLHSSPNRLAVRGARAASPRLLDVASPFLLIGLGLGGWFILTALIVVIELGVLMALRWAPLQETFKDVFVANLLSTLVGFCALAMTTLGLYYARGWTIYLIAFVLTLLIEGAYLLRLKRHTPGRTVRAALAMNVASYALLAFFIG